MFNVASSNSDVQEHKIIRMKRETLPLSEFQG